MQTEVDPQRLRRILEFIVAERNPFSGQRHLAEVESFVEAELKSDGINAENDCFSYEGKSFRNIIGELGAPADSIVILGAHFDSVIGAPGADDNGSGVAVLLESARILAQTPLRSRLLICAFNLEELNMIGSTHFVKKLKSAKAPVRGMISLEMVGYTDSRPGSQLYPAGLRWLYPDRGDFIGVIGNLKSVSLLRRVAREMRQVPELSVQTLAVPGKGEMIPAVRLSDHAPFWDANYPALMLTDTAMFRNPHYHRGSDALETLDVEFMAKVCQGVIRAISVL
jgi:Zn-dependent M28 family amino/carboxypeptidase